MRNSLFIKHLLWTLIIFALIFISAGRLLYWQGIVYVLIGLIMFVLNYTLLRIESDLTYERSKPGEGVKNWDKLILGLSILGSIIMYIIAGLDSGRFHWSPHFHWSIYLSGAILTLTGQLLFLIAQKQNRYFSSIVRIQTDREHTVCETGLYKFVRHPAYLGSLMQLAGFPLLFGSLWSHIPAIVSIILLLIRTNLEDRTLLTELKGYDVYANNTRYRIIPGLW